MSEHFCPFATPSPPSPGHRPFLPGWVIIDSLWSAHLSVSAPHSFHFSHVACHPPGRPSGLESGPHIVLRPGSPWIPRTAPAYVVSPSVRNRCRPAWGRALACSSAQNLHTHSVGRGLAISASPGALVETPSPRPHQTLGKTARRAHPPSTRHTSLLPFRSCLCHLSERPSQTTPSKMPPYSGSLFLFFTYLFTFKFISFSRNSFIFYNDMDKKYRVPMYPFIAPIPNFPYY